MPFSSNGGAWFDATGCFPIDADPVGLGEDCEHELSGSGWSGHDNCGLGALCWDFDEEGPGICKGLCDEGAPVCEQPGTVPYVGCQSCFCVCEAPCDPLLNECGEGQVCVVTGQIATCVADASGDAGAAGDPCEFVNQCDAGLFCANAAAVPNCDEGSSCCTPYCDTLAPDCPESSECHPLYERPGQAPPGLANVGMCLVP